MASLISFFILLLTAYTLAVPIGQQSSTIDYGLTTGQTTVGMNVTSNNLSTALPIVQKQRAVGDSSSIEVTTESVARTAREYDQKYKPNYGKVPKKSVTQQNRKKLSDSGEYQGARKWENQEGLFSSSSKDYKKRGDSTSQESFIQTTPTYKKRADSASQESLESTSSEKRESKEALIPTVTTGYKKRADSASQESLEINSKEKRESKEALIPTVTTGYKKRADSASQESLEINSKEKRESVISTKTKGYKKRSKAASQESLESTSSEKRESVYSTTTSAYKKRADSASQESLESSSSEKRAVSPNVVRPTTPGSKTITPKSYLFTTLESSTVFNRRAMRPVESEEEPESGSGESEQKMKMSSGVKPSSSASSFGKPSRPLNNEPVDQSSEESQSQLPIQTQKITKTVSVFPGKVRQNEVDSNVPSKSSSMMQPPPEEQLSQGQSQPESEKRKRDN